VAGHVRGCALTALVAHLKKAAASNGVLGGSVVHHAGLKFDIAKLRFADLSLCLRRDIRRCQQGKCCRAAINCLSMGRSPV